MLENTVAQLAPNLRNGILRNATIVVPLKYLSNFWKSLEIPLINCKVELKLEWAKCCFFSVVGNENNIHESTNANDIIFTIKDTNLYVPVVTLSARCNKKLSKLLSKGLKNQNLLDSIKIKFIGLNIKQKVINTTNEFRHFLESNFVRVNGLFVLVYTNEGNNAKRFDARKYYLPKGIIIIIL